MGLAFWLKSVNVANLPIVQSWYDAAHVSVFGLTLVLHALPGLVSLVLPAAWYNAAARPVLVGTARLAQAALPVFFSAVAHACDLVMPCLVLRIQFVDLFATKTLLVPLLLPLRWCWSMVPHVVYTITSTIALASPQHGMCAAVVRTNTTAITTGHTCGMCVYIPSMSSFNHQHSPST